MKRKSKCLSDIPGPSSIDARLRMERQGQRDTQPELKIRSAIHKQGYRFRVDYKPIKSLRYKADIAFPKSSTVVFIDGCFWHGCPIHSTWPKSNSDFWRNKIKTNQKRDAEVTRQLKKAGWKVVRIWEHEKPTNVIKKIVVAIKSDRRQQALCHEVVR